MNCKYCNALLKENAKFCSSCGHPVEEVNNMNNEVNTAPQVDNNMNMNDTYTTNVNYNQPSPTTQESKKGLAIASLIIGIISLLGFGFLFFPPIIGLILGICNKDKCGVKTAGIITNSISLFFVVIIYVLIFAFGVTFTKYAPSFLDSLSKTVENNNNWVEYDEEDDEVVKDATEEDQQNEIQEKLEDAQKQAQEALDNLKNSILNN